MPAAPRAASNGPSMVCGPCRLRRVTMLALAPAASQAMRSMATVMASDVFGLTTRMVGLSIVGSLQDCSAVSMMASIVLQNHTSGTQGPLDLKPTRGYVGVLVRSASMIENVDLVLQWNPDGCEMRNRRFPA